MDNETRLDLYKTMVLSRTFEEAILRDYHADKKPAWDIGAGLIPGEMHLSAGQEPVAAGICAHLSSDDAITTTHRPHHFAIAHGMDLKLLAAEIYGRETGLGKGRGGHMHLFDPSIHFSCSGIVAEGYPPALGQAFAFKRQGKDSIAVAVTGEGAANQGAFHESLNLASLWKLPVVFIIEDNDWAISVPRDASTAIRSNAVRATSYGIRGTRIQDNSVEGMWEASRTAVEKARAGEGPSLIEVHTVRLWGHFEGDAQAYRNDLDSLIDPIPAYANQLESDGVLTSDIIAATAAESKSRVAAAIEFAKSSPLPSPAEAESYVFA